MTKNYYVHHGGLMRCCLASLHEIMEKRADAPTDGEALACQYCGNGMVFRNGAFEWSGADCPWRCTQPRDVTYAVAEDGKSITFQPCGFTSHNPSDVAHKYCSRCHRFMDLIDLAKGMSKGTSKP